MESLGTLASGVAHDFNNILGIILGHASLLGDFRLDQGRTEQSVEAIKRAATRGAALVKQLLTFARKTESIMGPLLINDIVKEIAKLLTETFPKTIVVSTDLAPDLPLVVGDATQLHQVLLNLCVNSRDAMPKGGTLKISTSLLEGEAAVWMFHGAKATSHVLVRVDDTGIGMDQATKDRVFEPFFTTKEIEKGTGLGLALVHSIVASHGGFVDVESEPGKGTTVSFVIPVHSKSQQSGKPEHEGLDDIPGGTETILIIEDEEKLLELMKATLEFKGYSVLTAIDGAEGVEVFAHHRSKIAAIISDLGLPRLGGEDVFKKITALNPKVKVAIVSGYIDPEVKSSLRSAGVTHFIDKPYLPQEVLKMVRELIDGT